MANLFLNLFSVSDYEYFCEQQDFNKSYTVPRSSDLSQSCRRMFQTKRPASTAGIPSLPSASAVTSHSPGVATIRRTPSTKPSTRRGTGPLPIQTPVIPIKTLTLPDSMGVEAYLESEPGEYMENDSVLPVESWSGQASINPPRPAMYDGYEDPLEEGDTMLLAIRKGVKLKKAMTNDRSAPRVI